MRLANVSSVYGAPMGRRTVVQDDPDPAVRVKFRLARVYLDSGGYDSGGAYWGIGAPLYQAESDDSVMYFRASSRESAKAQVRARVPGAYFYR